MIVVRVGRESAITEAQPQDVRSVTALTYEKENEKERSDNKTVLQNVARLPREDSDKLPRLTFQTRSGVILGTSEGLV